jgi:hypothetical protein
LLKTGKTPKSINAKCDTFSCQKKSLKQSTFQELESLLATWLTQARGSNAVISATLLREKAVYTARRLGIEDFKASNDYISSFKQ